MICRKLLSAIKIEGTGLHSGKSCCFTALPSDKPLSISLNGSEAVPVSALRVEGSARGSDIIFPNGERVRTVEHLLSAVAGVGLWNTEIRVEGVEIPAIDGCAYSFANTLLSASKICECTDTLALSAPVCHDNGNGASVAAMPSERFRVTYVIKYDNPLIGTQMFDYAENDGDFFVKEISRARTFALERDIKHLRENGMALGGTLDNAILVCADEIKTNGGLRYADEFVRHKVLDLIGDLALVGRPLKAHIIAVRAGHAPHLELVEKLRRLLPARS